MERKNSKRNNIIKIIILGLYFMFNMVLLFRHEMWRDEINVWLMGRDLSVAELFREIKYQGHPCLWYLFNMPFAKLGLPCRIMGIFSLGFMSAAAWLFLWYAPFGLIAKTITLFSPIFTYYYAEIARGYCMVAFLIMVLAYFYKLRNQKPLFYGLLLGLLVQADTIALPVAGMISAMWLMENLWQSIKEKKKENIILAIKGLWIPLLSLFLFVFQFYRVSDSPVYEVQDLGLSEFITSTINYGYWIVERMTGMAKNGGFIIFAVLMVIGIGFGIIYKSVWPFLVLGTTVLFQCVFSVMVYQLNIFHFISLCFVYIWMVMVYGQKKEEIADKEALLGGKRRKIEWGMRLLSSAWIAIYSLLMFVRWNSPEEYSSISNALFGSYSDGVNTAAYIEDNLSTEELIITTDVAFTSTIWGFAPDYRAYYAGSGKENSYADWSEEQTCRITYENMLEWVKQEFPEKESFILIQSISSCIDEFAPKQMEVLYRTEVPSVKQEDYTIYRIKVEDER